MTAEQRRADRANWRVFFAALLTLAWAAFCLKANSWS